MATFIGVMAHTYVHTCNIQQEGERAPELNAVSVPDVEHDVYTFARTHFMSGCNMKPSSLCASSKISRSTSACSTRAEACN